MRLPRPAVLLITDRKVAARPLVEVVRAALDGGCRWLSLREKDLAPEDRLRLLDQMAGLARGAGAVLTVHQDLAAAARVDGVHLPRDGDPKEARAALGSNALIGLSAHNRTEALYAQNAGADYVTMSPVFPSLSKPGYDRALGIEGFRSVLRGLEIPVIALGGVTADDTAACYTAGAAGVAVCGAVMSADDPAGEMSEVLKGFEG